MESTFSHTLGCRQASYEHMSLLELAQRISDGSDAQALDQLHRQRPVFRQGDNRYLLLGDYLALFKQSTLVRRWCGNDCNAVEYAYDLTIDKFAHIPSDPQNGKPARTLGASVDHAKGPDCRYYYSAFVDYVTLEFDRNPPVSMVQAELTAAEILQRLVIRHFHYSCLESRRRMLKYVRRYAWNINNHVLHLLMPSYIPGRRCRNWLWANIPDVDPSRPGERDRIQAIIDRLLPRPQIFSLDTRQENGEIARATAKEPHWPLAEPITVKHLAREVADEKAENLDSQRPSIRRLGRQKLRDLIESVFDQLSRDTYSEGKLAAAFGLSRATFSRFAGSRWSNPTDDTGRASVPDLWLNTAHMLASQVVLIEAARRAGVWKKVTQVLDTDIQQEEIRL